MSTYVRDTGPLYICNGGVELDGDVLDDNDMYTKEHGACRKPVSKSNQIRPLSRLLSMWAASNLPDAVLLGGSHA